MYVILYFIVISIFSYILLTFDLSIAPKKAMVRAILYAALSTLLFKSTSLEGLSKKAKKKRKQRRKGKTGIDKKKKRKKKNERKKKAEQKFNRKLNSNSNRSRPMEVTCHWAKSQCQSDYTTCNAKFQECYNSGTPNFWSRVTKPGALYNCSEYLKSCSTQLQNCAVYCEKCKKQGTYGCLMSEEEEIAANNIQLATATGNALGGGNIGYTGWGETKNRVVDLNV